jgi:hypothetical protein
LGIKRSFIYFLPVSQNQAPAPPFRQVSSQRPTAVYRILCCLPLATNTATLVAPLANGQTGSDHIFLDTTIQTSEFALTWSHLKRHCVFQCLSLGPCPFNPVTLMSVPRYHVLYRGPLCPVPLGSKSPVRFPSFLVLQIVSIVTISLETLIFTSFGPVLFRFVISPPRSVFALLDHATLGPLSLGPCSYISHNIVRWRLQRFSPRTAGVKPKVLSKKTISLCHIMCLTLEAAETAEYNRCHTHELLNEVDKP